MKFFCTILTLNLIVIFIIIFLNDKVLAKKTKNQNNKKAISAINLRKSEKLIKLKHGKRSKFKLSTQLAKAKKICWSGQHISQRIIDGTNAARDTLPWIAAIYIIVDKKSFRFHCGAAIVSAKFVLTAAHCFPRKKPKPSDFKVYYGMHDLRSKDYVEGKIEKIYKHPKYKLGYNDIGLVRLKHDIKYNDIIYPICLPGLTTPTFWDKWAMGDPVLISGWGQYDNSINSTEEKSKELKKGYAQIVNMTVCKRSLFKSHNDFDFINNICLGKNESKNQFCSGDSGSPVIPLVYVEGKESFVFPVVIGIVSFGNIICSGPSIMTKVEGFMSWINSVTSKISY